MKLTRFQKFTVGLLFFYIFWEIAVQIWSKSEKTVVIRGDLAIIYPILLICLAISFFHYFKK